MSIRGNQKSQDGGHNHSVKVPSSFFFLDDLCTLYCMIVDAAFPPPCLNAPWTHSEQKLHPAGALTDLHLFLDRRLFFNLLPTIPVSVLGSKSVSVSFILYQSPGAFWADGKVHSSLMILKSYWQALPNSLDNRGQQPISQAYPQRSAKKPRWWPREGEKRVELQLLCHGCHLDLFCLPSCRYFLPSAVWMPHHADKSPSDKRIWIGLPGNSQPVKCRKTALFPNGWGDPSFPSSLGNNCPKEKNPLLPAGTLKRGGGSD